MSREETSLKYLFLTFLKIGAISWGGFMALISVVQNQFVEKDNKVSDELILDGISLASVLPGPLAFNVVSYVGYSLRGMKGAVVSMLGILLPSFILILILTHIYFIYGQLPVFSNFFSGVLPAVSAIIISVALKMTKKQVNDYIQIILLIASGVFYILSRAFFTSFLIMATGAFVGFLYYGKSLSDSPKKVTEPVRLMQWWNFKRVGILISVLATAVGITCIIHPDLSVETNLYISRLRSLIFTFSGMSLTLFGGGYVIIPVIREVVVNGLDWLTAKEFADAIAMGQITPGPIFISAAFIGYKVAGILGAVSAALAIFVPPAMLMIFCSRFLDILKHSTVVTAIFKGLRPVIIGMIFSAAYTIGKGADMSRLTVLIFISVLVLSLKFKVNVAYLIPAAGLVGMLLL